MTPEVEIRKMKVATWGTRPGAFLPWHLGKSPLNQEEGSEQSTAWFVAWPRKPHATDFLGWSQPSLTCYTSSQLSLFQPCSMRCFKS